MDPGRRKRGIDKGVTGVVLVASGLGKLEVTSKESQSLVNDETRKPQGREAQVRVESPSEGGGDVEDLTWFPLVPGGPSFPG